MLRIVEVLQALVSVLVLVCGVICEVASLSTAYLSRLLILRRLLKAGEKSKSTCGASCKDSSGGRKDDLAQAPTSTPMQQSDSAPSGFWNSKNGERPTCTYSLRSMFQRIGLRSPGTMSSTLETKDTCTREPVLRKLDRAGVEFARMHRNTRQSTNKR